MKKITIATLVITMAVLFSMSALAETINIRLAHGSPRGHPNAMQAELLKAELEKATNGRLKITVFGDRQLGDDREAIQLVSAGTVDMAYASSVNFPLILNKVAFDALQLPFLVKSYDDLAKVLQSEAADKILASIEDVGLKGLCYSDGGHRHFLNSKYPVLKMEDFKGLKTRIVPIPLFKAIWERTGANPVGVPYGEVYTAMQTHVIDAVEFNISSIEADNVYEVAKNLSLTGHYFWPGLFFYSKKKLEGLPQDLQKIILDTCRQLTPKFVLHTRDEEKKSIVNLKEKGVKFFDFEDRDKMIELMKPVYEEWQKKSPLIGEYIEVTKKF